MGPLPESRHEDAGDFGPPPEFDDYVILRELGRGQMGRVYLAEDALLARQVAIKFIAGVEPDLAARQRFIMEARAAARIQHPNVVAVYRVGELAERPYIVSELVRGTPLSELPRPMPDASVLELGVALARGLAAAHRRGVIHCDIKLGNAMVTEDGIAKLVDFGLARIVHEGADEGAPGPVVGTPDYMAPEVWMGRAPSRASDVYSLGAVLFELLAGQPPFAEVPAHELQAAATRSRPDLEAHCPNSDMRLVRVVERCLDPDPAKRYDSGEELREALEQLHPSRAQRVNQDSNPYRGLRPFEAAHRGLFFGRGIEIGEVLERLRTDSIVIVTGDSGVGKSSLCRAGVVPSILDGALASGTTWEAVAMIPGSRPLSALATALGDPTLIERVLGNPEELPRQLQRRAGAGGIVLFVDQMEELVTVGDPVEVAAFAAGLARISEGVPGIRLIATVRADFLSRIAALPRFGRELSRLLYFVSPLPPDRIRDVVVGPAAATGVEFESPEVIEAIVAATTEARTGALPLLSFALAELWERRDRERNVITQDALDAMGGVAGALSRHADSVLSGMDGARRAAVRGLLLRLVTALGTRIRRTAAELGTSEGSRAALDMLVDGRLLVVHQGDDGTTYELAHEILIHGWGALREWLDHDADAREQRDRISAGAAEWSAQGKRPDLTWRGPRLAAALALETAQLTPLEREFLVASSRAQRRRSWIRRSVVAGVVLMLLGTYAIQLHRARSRLAGAIELELSAARGFLDVARTAERDGRALASVAFTAFDSGRTDIAEEWWRVVIVERAAAEAAYRKAARRLEAALAQDPTRTDNRALLGDILYERALLADSAHEPDQRDELIGRLAAYDADGSRRARWTLGGTVVIHTPPDATVKVGAERWVKSTGEIQARVPAGSLTIEVRATGREAVRDLVLVERGATTEVTMLPPATGSVPAGYVYVPRGAFLAGSTADEDSRISFFQTVPLHRRTLGAFLIARTEVTIAEWIEFVTAQPPAEQAALLPRIDAHASGAVIVERDLGTWRITLQPMGHRSTARWGEPLEYPGRVMRSKQDWRRFPVTGVSGKDGERYAAWLDQTERVPGARLCDELEWERAARGADGRSYATGDRLEPGAANLDITHGRDRMGPDEVGSYPQSVSPYGLLDTSGNAFEWTRGEHGGYVVRGGSYYHDRKTANLANRYIVPGDLHDASLGLRICATAPSATSSGKPVD